MVQTRCTDYIKMHRMKSWPGFQGFTCQTNHKSQVVYFFFYTVCVYSAPRALNTQHMALLKYFKRNMLLQYVNFWSPVTFRTYHEVHAVKSVLSSIWPFIQSYLIRNGVSYIRYNIVKDSLTISPTCCHSTVCIWAGGLDLCHSRHNLHLDPGETNTDC